jgi:hypothetical protein
MGNSEIPNENPEMFQVSLPLRQRWCIGRVARLRGSPSGPEGWCNFVGERWGKVWENYGKMSMQSVLKP